MSDCSIAEAVNIAEHWRFLGSVGVHQETCQPALHWHLYEKNLLCVTIFGHGC